MKPQALRILLVEDNAGDALLLREMFRKEKAGSFELTHMLRMSEAVAHLAKGAVDVVLLDLGLPDGHGLDTVRRAHSVAPDVPVIVLTGLDDEALAAAAMAEGAQDYLIKGQIENRALPRALRHASDWPHARAHSCREGWSEACSRCLLCRSELRSVPTRRYPSQGCPTAATVADMPCVREAVRAERSRNHRGARRRCRAPDLSTHRAAASAPSRGVQRRSAVLLVPPPRRGFGLAIVRCRERAAARRWRRRSSRSSSRPSLTR